MHAAALLMRLAAERWSQQSIDKAWTAAARAASALARAGGGSAKPGATVNPKVTVKPKITVKPKSKPVRNLVVNTKPRPFRNPTGRSVGSSRPRFGRQASVARGAAFARKSGKAMTFDEVYYGT